MKCNSNPFVVFQLWYSQQAMEGNVPGHPLGFDCSQRFGPIKMVGGEGGGDENHNAAADGSDSD